MARAQTAAPSPTLPRRFVLNPVDLPDRLLAGDFPSVILTGPEGSGKMSLALWWACARNCVARDREAILFEDDVPETPAACGQCRTCRLILARQHPDLFVLEPAEDTTGLKIEQIREVQSKLIYRPLEARTRFVILGRAETLTEGAANALLKTLEEPPGATALVLLASHPAALLPTVQSRCRIFKLLPVDAAPIADWLVAELGVDLTPAALAARLSEGAPGRARRILEDAGWWETRGEALTVYQEACSGHLAPLRAAATADEMAKLSRDRLMRHLEMGATWLRDCLLVAQREAQGLPITADHLINLDRIEDVQRIAAGRTAVAWAQGLSQLAEARRQLKANANVKLQLQLLLQQLSG